MRNMTTYSLNVSVRALGVSFPPTGENFTKNLEYQREQQAPGSAYFSDAQISPWQAKTLLGSYNEETLLTKTGGHHSNIV